MSNKRVVAGFFDRRWARRVVIAPVVFLLAIVAVVLSPIALIVSVVLDLVRRRGSFPRTRLVVLIVGALVIEAIGIVTSLLVWMLTGFGLAGSRRGRWQLYRAFMGLYTSAMLGLIAKVIGTRIEWRDTADLATGPVVVIARHTSFFDALIPATVLSRRSTLLAHHVLTHGLRYAPCLDIVGHRFPNRFIKRTPGHGSSELPHLEEIGTVLDSRSGAIIFPEGTFRNPHRFERAIRRLRRKQPDLAARAETLDHVLPPRPSGTWALLEGAPDADLVVCVNTGLEPYGSIADIVGGLAGDQPILIETWRIPRSDIPSNADEFDDWLFDQYVEIDAWVARNAFSS